ncbi:MAG: hypothetical protein ACSLEL_02200 [Candidatus Malihini olakiniferum]
MQAITITSIVNPVRSLPLFFAFCEERLAADREENIIDERVVREVNLRFCW